MESTRHCAFGPACLDAALSTPPAIMFSSQFLFHSLLSHPYPCCSISMKSSSACLILSAIQLSSPLCLATTGFLVSLLSRSPSHRCVIFVIASTAGGIILVLCLSVYCSSSPPTAVRHLLRLQSFSTGAPAPRHLEHMPNEWMSLFV